MTKFYEGIPHLKLPPKRLLGVLEAVRAYQPDRDRVSEGIRSLFPGLSVQSVVRGMALPAATRLHLVRATSTEISLAPNGIGVTQAGLPPEVFLGLAIRTVAIRRFGLSLEEIRNPGLIGFNLATAPPVA